MFPFGQQQMPYQSGNQSTWGWGQGAQQPQQGGNFDPGALSWGSGAQNTGGLGAIGGDWNGYTGLGMGAGGNPMTGGYGAAPNPYDPSGAGGAMGGGGNPMTGYYGPAPYGGPAMGAGGMPNTGGLGVIGGDQVHAGFGMGGTDPNAGYSNYIPGMSTSSGPNSGFAGGQYINMWTPQPGVDPSMAGSNPYGINTSGSGMLPGYTDPRTSDPNYKPSGGAYVPYGPTDPAMTGYIPPQTTPYQTTPYQQPAANPAQRSPSLADLLAAQRNQYQSY